MLILDNNESLRKKKKNKVLVLATVELIFFIVAHIILYLGFVKKTVMITL